MHGNFKAGNIGHTTIFLATTFYHGSVPRIHMPTRWRSPCSYDITLLGKSRGQASNTARVPRFIVSQFAAMQAFAVSEPWLTVAQRLHNGLCCRFMRSGNASDTTLYPGKTAAGERYKELVRSKENKQLKSMRVVSNQHQFDDYYLSNSRDLRYRCALQFFQPTRSDLIHVWKTYRIPGFSAHELHQAGCCSEDTCHSAVQC